MLVDGSEDRAADLDRVRPLSGEKQDVGQRAIHTREAGQLDEGVLILAQEVQVANIDLEDLCPY